MRVQGKLTCLYCDRESIELCVDCSYKAIQYPEWITELVMGIVNIIFRKKKGRSK